MTDIEVLEPQLIERYLRGRELKFQIDLDAHYIVNFYGDGVPDHRFGINVEGPPAEVLAVRVVSDTPFPEPVRPAAEAFVSGWNQRMRWPKGFTDDDSRGRGFWIIGENCFTLRAGIHFPLFAERLDTSISAGAQLMSESARALGGVDDLETWLRDAG